MNKKEKRLKRIWHQFRIFLRPYRFGLYGAMFLILVTNVCMAIAPSMEGMITSLLVSDVQKIKNGVPGAAIQFDRVLQIIALLLVIYITKTVVQVAAVFLLTNSIQNTMHDLRNAVPE